MAVSDYISRKELIKSFCNECDGYCEFVECDCISCKSEHRCAMVQEIDAIPAADVRPVMLCKDCVHYEMGVCLKIYDDGNASKDAWQERKPTDFCSYGEDRNVPTKESEEVSAVRCWLTNGADMRGGDA